jgi:hypothetical protein
MTALRGEVLDPEPDPPRRTFFEKYGPTIFVAAVFTLPAMNLGASLLDYKTAKVNLRIAELEDKATSLS